MSKLRNPFSGWLLLVLEVMAPFPCVDQYQMSSNAIDVANNELLIKLL